VCRFFPRQGPSFRPDPPIAFFAAFAPRRTSLLISQLSFLYSSQDLLVDWRLGERYFMQAFVDGDLASNNGGWQWTASVSLPLFPSSSPFSLLCLFPPVGNRTGILLFTLARPTISRQTGTDPQPYFRIFNMTSQAEKADPSGDYIRHFVPELKNLKGKGT
jgi:deoxyribodipyrimidine photo-lyase